MTDILVVVFPIGLAAGFAVGYAVRAAISLRHRQAAMKRRYLLG
jgi:L-aminopeptidase/D-esterase-like protein